MTPRRIFIAGSTGAVGRTMVRLADAAGTPVVPHLRRRHGVTHPNAVVCDLADQEAVVQGMTGCTTVVQLIWTTRARFSKGDTYATSDIGTTEELVVAAKRAGIDHVVLLSSVGAGRPLGAYLKAKARAEAIVRASGIAWTIFRPSVFVGEGHDPSGILKALLSLSARYRPIAVEVLARTILAVATHRAPVETVLEGRVLWTEVGATGA